VIDEVFHLKNSVAKHRPAEEFAAIRSRIARTRERLEKTAWQLEQFGSAKAAGYLRRWLPSIVTFAEHAVEGFEVPWTSNPVERLMGEVSKRCKNQWMRWTAEGLEAILQLRLVKYADPEYYQAFLDELLQRSTKTVINCDLSIESTSGKVQTALQHDPFQTLRAILVVVGVSDPVGKSAVGGCGRPVCGGRGQAKAARWSVKNRWTAVRGDHIGYVYSHIGFHLNYYAHIQASSNTDTAARVLRMQPERDSIN